MIKIHAGYEILVQSDSLSPPTPALPGANYLCSQLLDTLTDEYENTETLNSILASIIMILVQLPISTLDLIL